MENQIILLFGGESEERLVSVASAQCMAAAIKPRQLWFWHKAGPIYLIDHEELMAHDKSFTDEFKPKNKPDFNDIKNAIASSGAGGQVFLLALHGGQGENGHVQGLLEQHGRAYTGSGPEASRLAFDKAATKESLARYGIKMAPHEVIESASRADITTRLKAFFEAHGAFIVKPVCGGSSIGCAFSRSLADIDAVAEQVLAAKEPFLLEKLIEGREFTVGVIDDGGVLKGLPCTEIRLKIGADFDYEGKYLGGATELTPADLSESQAREAQSIAIAAHRGLELTGYSRTDLILAADGFYFLETNTLPGLSRQSLVPQQLAVLGISMREFLVGQMAIAQERKRRQSR